MTCLVTVPGQVSRWNDAVGELPGGNLFQAREWGQVKDQQGWTPHRLLVERSGRPVAAALVLTRQVPLLGTLMYSPCGPLLDWTDGDASSRLMERAAALAERSGAFAWRTEPRIPAGDEAAADALERAGLRTIPEEWSYWNRPKYDMHLPLAGGEAAVFARLGSRTRGKIRSVARAGVVVERARGIEDIEDLFRLLTNTSRKKRIPMRGVAWFRTLYETLGTAGGCGLFVARRDGTAIAAGMSARFGRTAGLLYLGSDYSVNHVGYAVQWEMLRWAIASGCTLYDFAGTATSFPPRPTDRGWGVYQFKLRFGAEVVAWHGYADAVYRPLAYASFRAVERNLPRLERLIVDVPRAVVQRFGPRAAPAPAPALGAAPAREFQTGMERTG